MKKLSQLLFLSFLAFAITSCDDDEGVETEVGTVELNFLAKYGDEPFMVLTEEYEFADGKAIRFQEEFGFYIADVVLLEGDGNDEVELTDIDYVDFSNNSTEEMANDPFKIVANNIPVGDYRGIKFKVGVPADLNAGSSNDYGEDHPLGAENRYWAPWASYTFVRLDGCYDKDGQGLGSSCNTADGDNISFIFHAGGDEALRDIPAFIREFNLEPNTTNSFTFNIDVAEILGTGVNAIDFGDGPSIHTNSITDQEGLELRDKLMDNFAARAITLE